MSNSHDVPEIRDLTPVEQAVVDEIYQGKQQLIRVGGYCLPKEFKKLASDIFNMPLRSSDIFVTSYQRSGTTWTQELVWLLANDLAYEKAAAMPLPHRYPFLEFAMYFDERTIEKVIKVSDDADQTRKVIKIMATPATKILAETPSPRFVKTHLPFSLLPPKLLDTTKVFYVARDPRDVIVSSFHHGKLFRISEFPGEFKQLWKAFKMDIFTLTPYFEHVKEAWALRHHPNMMFLFYEDLSKDLPASIRSIAKFLDKELTEAQMERLCDHLSIDSFKKNKSVNFEDTRELGFMTDKETFIRKGKSGGWRDYFDEEMTREAESWIEDNLRDSDLRFPSLENK